MPAKTQLLTFFFTLLCYLVQATPVAADAGDVIAGLLGTFMCLIAICAFLGWWSRRGNPQHQSGGGSEGETA